MKQRKLDKNIHLFLNDIVRKVMLGGTDQNASNYGQELSDS